MKKSNSFEKLSAADPNIVLGPTQRQQIESRDPSRKPFAKLLLLITCWWLVTFVLCVLRFNVEATPEAVLQLTLDVLLFRRHPLAATDGASATAATAIAVSGLLLADVLVCSRLVPNDGARWFLLHSIGNFFVVVLAAPDFVYALETPPLALSASHCSNLASAGRFAPCSDWPTCMIIALHAYHIMAFELDAQDIFHHVLFVPIIAGGHFIWPWGTSSNILAFFISGLPGAIDYFLLAMVKSGKLAPIVEKRINCSINTWLRSPGISGFVVLATCAYIGAEKFDPESSKHFPPAWLFVPMMFLVFFNGQFYAQRVIGNYYVRKTHQMSKLGVKHVELHNS